MIRKILLSCGIASSILYVVSDIIGARRYAGYSYTDQVFSELLAEGSPVRTLMITINGVPYTLLIGGFAVGIWKFFGEERDARITAAMLTGYAVTGMVGGVFFPMAARGTESSLRNTMHIPATGVMSVFILLAMGFGARLLGPRFRSYTYGTIVLLLVFGVLTSTQGGKIADNHATPWVGIEERVNIYATMLWMAVFAAAVLGHKRTLPDARLESRGLDRRQAKSSVQGFLR